MSAARYEGGDLRGIRVLCAFAAALLASACGGSSDPVSLQSDATPATTAASSPPASEGFYTLGGTVSGLTRTGLVLANGANIVSVAAHTTSFTLPTPVAYANRYAVTVATQPEGLTCSVSHGSGAMPAGDVTRVRVKCLENAYPVSAAAGSLDTTGLMLLLALARSSRSSHF
jgi:hypothetical protein